jgi:GNAT superfamily N-acetyltransferase
VSVTVRAALLTERGQLEALQMRSALANPGDREAVLANLESIVVPEHQIADGRVFVAESGGRLCGFCTVVERGDGHTELDGLFVEPTLWRSGSGRALVERAKQYASEHGSNWLYVVGNAHAKQFYEACGFESLGVESTEFGTGLLMRVSIAA